MLCKGKYLRVGNVLSESVYIDSVSLAQVRGTRSLGYDRQSSMAMHDANVRIALHEGVEGYDPEHSGLYSVAGNDSTGGNCTLPAFLGCQVSASIGLLAFLH